MPRQDWALAVYPFRTGGNWPPDNNEKRETDMNMLNGTNGRNSLWTSGLVLTALVMGLAGCGVEGVTPAGVAGLDTSGWDWIDELGTLAGIEDLGEFIYLNGRLVAGNPELDPSLVQSGDDAKFIDDDKSVAPPRSTIKLKLSTNKNNVAPNTQVTFTAKITSAVGGTAPYYGYWWLEGDKNWSRGGGTYTRTLTKSPRQSIYMMVIDAKGKESDIYSIDINVPSPTTYRLCNSIAGTWTVSNSYQPMVLTVGSTGTVTGSYNDGCGKIWSGRVISSPSNCPSCVVVEALWDETEAKLVNGIPNCSVRADQARWKGDVQFIFNPELSAFTAKWSFDGDSHWQSSQWSGSRSRCN
jgi:hypothetical protein